MADPDVTGPRPTRSDVLAASHRLAPHIVRTPLSRSRRFGGLLKLENLQATGAFKVRGALNAALAGLERGDSRTLVTGSAGNHGLGVAWAAQRCNVPSVVVLPRGAPRSRAHRRKGGAGKAASGLT